jgi:uncharacterized protein
MKQIWSFLLGGLFSVGLMLSGMSNPENVLRFLDIFGDWDFSLALVMMGAILVAFIPFQKASRQKNAKTMDGTLIQFPQQQQIDRPLIIGAILFGIGWGIAGICPAPALTLIGLGHYEGLYFIASMIVGMLVYQKILGNK